MTSVEVFMYRFDDIVGNEQTIKYLKGVMSHQRVSHAYILKGPQGSGKRLMAETFAAALQCEKGVGVNCGTCVSCKTMVSHNHPDVFYIQAKKQKTIGADDIREQVIQEMDIRPYQHRYKIFIIENAQTMTIAAQNVLLKTLEEPPSYGVFLILAEHINGFLPTVLSRCIVLQMAQLTTKAVENYLVHQCQKDFKESRFFASYALGSIGRAIELSEDEDFLHLREFMIGKLCRINLADAVEVMLWAKEFEAFKEKASELLDIGIIWFRDVFVVKRLGSTADIIQKDKEADIVEQAENIEFKQLGDSLKALWAAKRQLEQNGNFQLIIEIMLMNIKGV